MENHDFSDLTRNIYHEQHKRIANDEKAMNRFLGMYSHEYFGLDKKFFSNAKALDAGCGDTAKLLIALYRMGCRDIHGMDLGNDFLPIARSSLHNFDVPEDIVSLKTGSVIDLPYKDNEFDFVCCHGVMQHLNNVEEAEQAFSELSRVVAPGGYLYTVYSNVGGLLEEAIFPAIRDYYHKDDNFKKFVDKISPEMLHDLCDMIYKERANRENVEEDLDGLKELLDVDLCVTVQNVIQAPVRMTQLLNEQWVANQYDKCGFDEPRRLRRYVKRKNIRKFFAPLHFNIENEVSKILYGTGNLEYISQKSA